MLTHEGSGRSAAANVDAVQRALEDLGICFVPPDAPALAARRTAEAGLSSKLGRVQRRGKSALTLQ